MSTMLAKFACENAKCPYNYRFKTRFIQMRLSSFTSAKCQHCGKMMTRENTK